MEITNEFGWRTSRLKICDVCQSEAVLIHDIQLYGVLYYEWPFHWWCPNCNARCECVFGTDTPIKAMDSLTLRRARGYAHNWLDKLWKTRKERTEVYKWLADKMEMTYEECHISRFNVEQCKEVVRLSRERYIKESGL